MQSFNRVVVAGRLVADPVQRYVAGGKAVANASLAINERWADAEGVERERVTFVDVQAWGRTAEALAGYTRKGSGVLVEGRLRGESWTAADGQKRSKLVVVAERVVFLDGGPAKQAELGLDGQAEPEAQPAASDEDSQVPF
jgi:single-strand DNA-binding protein